MFFNKMDYRIVKHKRSNQVVDNQPKLPTPDQLEYGELAINYAKNYETISFKNSADEIITIEPNYKIIEIKYDNLKKLRDDQQLIKGNYYRIIDYVTTTSQNETQSALHPFDIIVEALDNNTLSENVKICQNAKDDYFNNNYLSSWIVKYCLDNDTNRFTWADTTNGKGVIYYMKDEFNNEAWYDFKNIMFLRTYEWMQDNKNFPNINGLTADTYFYTFTCIKNNIITDDSLNSNKFHATDNHLGRSTNSLNNTIFINTEGKGAYCNSIADGHQNNTFGEGIWLNRIGYNFQNNIIYKLFQRNEIDSEFKNNKIMSLYFADNVTKSPCSGNTFDIKTRLCSFKQNFLKNTFINTDAVNDEIVNCVFGSDINEVHNFSNMANVVFENRCLYNLNNPINFQELTTITNENLSQILSAKTNDHEWVVYKDENDKYGVFNRNIKLDDDYTQSSDKIALSLSGANELYNNITSLQTIVEENEETCAILFNELFKKITSLQNEINDLKNK